MGKGYAEGPAAEAAEARRDALELGLEEPVHEELRAAVYGSTEDDAERHFLGWADEVDADALFADGKSLRLPFTRVRMSPAVVSSG